MVEVHAARALPAPTAPISAHAATASAQIKIRDTGLAGIEVDLNISYLPSSVACIRADSPTRVTNMGITI
jgi:hypothetical protein